MLKALILHEMQNLLKSKRVYWTVVLFLLLFAAVFTVRVINYQSQINQYIADKKMAEEELQNAANYSHIKLYAIQQPLVFSIYNQGYKASRVAFIQFYEPILKTISLNEETNLYYNRDNKLDITFLITFFLSLFILLISYDSINGEKQTGTLRIIMTYPVKRQSFVLKKILGIFCFVALAFTLPYVISLFILIIIYTNLLTASFFLSAFFYWLLILLFIFFFSLLGVLISISAKIPNRSLVFTLFIWLLLSIILPISWEFILSPQLFHNELNKLTLNYEDKLDQSKRIFYLNDLNTDKYDKEKLNINLVSHLVWSGYFYNSSVWGFDETYDQHYRFMQYVIDEYYPASREVEQAIDKLYRKQISIQNYKNWVFFFNPIVLFENMSTKIAGNSQTDYLRHLQDTRDIRDDIVNRGLDEGWLKDYRYFARRAESENLGSYDDISKKFNYDPEKTWDYIMVLINDPKVSFAFELPDYRKYSQPQLSFGELFNRILPYLLIFVFGIITLWIIIWRRFMKYDVR